MNRLVTLAAASAVTALAFLPAVQTAQAAEAGADSVSVTCGAMPGGGFIYNAKTLNSTPARTGPYEACSKTRTYSAGTTVGIACWLYNDYNNLWYKTNSNTYVYSSHFSSTVKSHVDSCEG
ncbi:hypothetical protein EV138_5703 [Kribbella voronezhensis]|uniref:SH3 domain-containing protein n=1 Tax=Kribbella voronezhensis TaxID=2512212 RepID=A0A4R7SVP2_9ACTN|nr:hypothetical protein [Kribbella voronezhensis]TDU83241.1 hypothetical protein EV138_5703 [Kribbella voronezhensis]